MKKHYKYIGYVFDLIPLVQELLVQNTNVDSNDDFALGQCDGYKDVWHIMKQEAEKKHLSLVTLRIETQKQTPISDEVIENSDYVPYKQLIKQIVQNIDKQLNTLKQQQQNAYAKGKRLAYYDILTIMQMQAELAFGIDLAEIKLQRNLDLLLV